MLCYIFTKLDLDLIFLLTLPLPEFFMVLCQLSALSALSALCVRSLILQMKKTPQNHYLPAIDERMAVHCLESGCIGKYISLGRKFGTSCPRICPRFISRASGDVFPNTPLLLAMYGYNIDHTEVEGSSLPFPNHHSVI